MQKHVNLVDLVKSFPTSYSNVYLLARIAVCGCVCSSFDAARPDVVVRVWVGSALTWPGASFWGYPFFDVGLSSIDTAA